MRRRDAVFQTLHRYIYRKRKRGALRSDAATNLQYNETKMKKYLILALAALTGGAFVACSGSEDGGGDPSTATSITLAVDKETIEADGADAVRFTVTTDTGVDITGMQGVRILIPGEQGDADAVFLDGMEYTSVTNGPVTFQARYNGMLSNKVTVTAQNRGEYEKYMRRLLIADLTSVGCINCPNMTTVLESLAERYPDRLEVLTYHTDYDGNVDPFSTELLNSIYSDFGIMGFPAAVVDFRIGINGANSSRLMQEIEASLYDYPATCGIKLSSSYDDAKQEATVVVTVAGANEVASEYTLGYLIVADNIEAVGGAAQKGADASYVHNGVVLAGSEYLGGRLDGGLQAGVEREPVTIKFNVGGHMQPEYFGVEDLRVVAYVMAKNDDNTYYVNNVASCAVDGGSADYVLNE